MHSHRDMQTAFRAGLADGAIPPGVTAVGDVGRRFSVYRNTVAHSLTEALSQRFPTVQRLVGPAFFKASAQVFIADHPPLSAVLHDYGTAFPAFLARFPPTASLPYLPDVARIEILRGQAYHAADAAPLPVSTVSAAFALEPEAVRLYLHPSVRLMTSSHPAASIWAMNQPGATPAELHPHSEAALIFRHGEDVMVVKVGADTAHLIGDLQGGSSLGTACADAAPDDAAEVVAILLKHGLITGLTKNRCEVRHD